MSKDFDVFSIESGPVRLAEEFLASNESEPDFLERIQLSNYVATGGLMLETLGTAAAVVEARLQDAPSLATRLFDLSTHRNLFRPTTTAKVSPERARPVRRKICEALLLPWQHAAPPERTRRQISDYLLHHYGDLRVESGPWENLRTPARDIMSGWLRQRTIETFFQSSKATTPDNRQRWEASRRFWMAYQEHIDHAWFLAGPRDAAALKTEPMGYGRVLGCRADFSALLLTIRGITIAEASTFESCEVWLRENDFAPPLYRDKTKPYWPVSFTTGADFSPVYSRDGLWQDRLHNLIQDRTGISIARHAYLR